MRSGLRERHAPVGVQFRMRSNMHGGAPVALDVEGGLAGDGCRRDRGGMVGQWQEGEAPRHAVQTPRVLSARKPGVGMQ